MRISCMIVFFLLCSSLASACSCSNSTPIQRTPATRYGNGAVFTARVVEVIGGYNFDGKRSSPRVIAIIHHRYWGLPSYWPNIVILDSGFFCNFGMDEEEYLVSGSRSRYGVVDVGMCSRTQPLASAQVDLRTLDGSLCTGEGGTLIGKVSMGGKVSYNAGNRQDLTPARNVALTFRDFYGKAYVTQSDDEGIYELLHVPPGPYFLDSSVMSGRYAVGGGDVHSGVCKESPVEISTHDVSGRLAPRIDRYTSVELDGHGGQKSLITSLEGLRGQGRGRVTPDGRFYFEAVPPGEYTLVARFGLPGHPGEGTKVYYPGTSNPEKAIPIRVPNQASQSFDFDPNTLPLISVPFFFESPNPSHPMRIDVRVQSSSGLEIDGFLTVTGIPMSIAVVRGEAYKVVAYGYSDDNKEEPDWPSETVRLTAASGMKIIRLAFPPLVN